MPGLSQILAYIDGSCSEGRGTDRPRRSVGGGLRMRMQVFAMCLDRHLVSSEGWPHRDCADGVLNLSACGGDQ
jgi:hypothetical protein